MKAVLLFLLLTLLCACGEDVTHTEVKEVCSADNPPITLPNEVVCNHSPSNNIQVEGHDVVYICTKIKGPKND